MATRITLSKSHSDVTICGSKFTFLFILFSSFFFLSFSSCAGLVSPGPVWGMLVFMAGRAAHCFYAGETAWCTLVWIIASSLDTLLMLEWTDCVGSVLFVYFSRLWFVISADDHGHSSRQSAGEGLEHLWVLCSIYSLSFCSPFIPSYRM